MYEKSIKSLGFTDLLIGVGAWATFILFYFNYIF